MKQDLPDLQPKVVLGVAAHPDDLDFGAGGTIATFRRAGAAIHYLILTDGGKGTADPNISPEQLTKTRQQEQQQALQKLGGGSVEFLDYPDGCLEVNLELKKEIVKAIRTIKPDVVITLDPSMLYSADHGFINHPDHRAAGQAALDAVYPLARDHLSFPDLFENGLHPHITPTVLLINFNEPNYFVDIASTFEQKCQALCAHKSQMPSETAVRQHLSESAAAAGKLANCDRAEAFVRIDIR